MNSVQNETPVNAKKDLRVHEQEHKKKKKTAEPPADSEFLRLLRISEFFRFV